MPLSHICKVSKLMPCPINRMDKEESNSACNIILLLALQRICARLCASVRALLWGITGFLIHMARHAGFWRQRLQRERSLSRSARTWPQNAMMWWRQTNGGSRSCERLGARSWKSKMPALAITGGVYVSCSSQLFACCPVNLQFA